MLELNGWNKTFITEVIDYQKYCQMVHTVVGKLLLKSS
jgi:hypothetical protein